MTLAGGLAVILCPGGAVRIRLNSGSAGAKGLPIPLQQVLPGHLEIRAKQEANRLKRMFTA